MAGEAGKGAGCSRWRKEEAGPAQQTHLLGGSRAAHRAPSGGLMLQ